MEFLLELCENKKEGRHFPKTTVFRCLKMGSCRRGEVKNLPKGVARMCAKKPSTLCCTRVLSSHCMIICEVILEHVGLVFVNLVFGNAE